MSVQCHVHPQSLTINQKLLHHLYSLTRTTQLTRTRTCAYSWHNVVRPPGHLSYSQSCYQPPCLTHSLISLKATPPRLTLFSSLLSHSSTIPPFVLWRFLVQTLRSGASPLQNHLIPSCHDPGVDQGMEQPGTNPGEENRPTLIIHALLEPSSSCFPPL